MSALGQKQTCAVQEPMSALPPKADMCGATRDVRFGPIADSCTAAILSLFDHQVGAAKQRKRYRLGWDAGPVGALATDQFPLDERDVQTTFGEHAGAVLPRANRHR
jgi:hypothetical protein